jgi:sulfur carrier protein ThiS
MTVTVRTQGLLEGSVPADGQKYGPFYTQVEEVCTVGDVIERLRLPRATGLVILVNGRLAHWGTELRDGDTVELLPVVGGG